MSRAKAKPVTHLVADESYYQLTVESEANGLVLWHGYRERRRDGWEMSDAFCLDRTTARDLAAYILEIYPEETS